MFSRNSMQNSHKGGYQTINVSLVARTRCLQHHQSSEQSGWARRCVLLVVGKTLNHNLDQRNNDWSMERRTRVAFKPREFPFLTMCVGKTIEMVLRISNFNALVLPTQISKNKNH